MTDSFNKYIKCSASARVCWCRLSHELQFLSLDPNYNRNSISARARPQCALRVLQLCTRLRCLIKLRADDIMREWLCLPMMMMMISAWSHLCRTLSRVSGCERVRLVYLWSRCAAPARANERDDLRLMRVCAHVNPGQSRYNRSSFVAALWPGSVSSNCGSLCNWAHRQIRFVLAKLFFKCFDKERLCLISPAFRNPALFPHADSVLTTFFWLYIRCRPSYESAVNKGGRP